MALKERERGSSGSIKTFGKDLGEEQERKGQMEAYGIRFMSGEMFARQFCD